ncbi:MAG TPA: hypothetical protein ENI17_02065 [Pseudomonas xinjiangensis]|uniref:Uncharacterized protein n=2 Tax=root TaxID=1 RepID=A0A7V1BMI9_9GAMM|nr:hypothetical protein [Halopseudomonas xinjiangensis]HEC46398.1 hypothetical protein [Halopseudomonas xinjiangensis]
MPERITKNTLTDLLKIEKQPCLSLYMPTHRTSPEREQDPIRYRNLLGQLQQHLDAQFPDADQDALLRPFNALLADRDFWVYQKEGVAMLGGENFFKVYSLQQRVPECASVNVHPHLSPLLRITQSADRYQVLCLSRDEVRLFEGNREVLDEIQPDPDVPLNQEQALGSELTPGDQSGHPDGFSAAGDRGDTYMHESGGSGKQDEIDSDRDRFFRAVDRAIMACHSKPSGLPLILVALPENEAFFRALSHNDQLLDQSISIDPAALNINELRKRSGEVIAQDYTARLDALLDQHGAANGQGLTSDDITEIGKAALAGRVATLFVEEDRMIPGELDHQSGRVTLEEDNPDGPDVLDELIVHALRNGAQVVTAPAQRMPCTSGAAAIFRF